MTDIEFGLHYSLQTHHGDWERLYEETLRQARLAEELGYSSLNIAEHHFMEDGWIPAPTVMLGGMAAVTDGMTVGTEITIMPLHDPVTVAEHATVLDLMSRGRFRLGVAIGWRDEEFEAFGVPKEERVPRTVEGIELTRRLFEEESVTFDGEFRSVEDLTVMPRPVQNSLEVRYGGQSESAVRRAARIADAWIMSPIESRDQLVEKVEGVYEPALEEHGRSLEEVDKPLRREVYVAEDDETAWQEVGEALLYEYRDVYSTGYDDVGAAFDGTTDDDAMDALKKHAEDRFIVGGPETAIEEIEAYREEVGVDEFLMRIHFPGLDPDLATKCLRTFDEEVLPYFEGSSLQ